MSKTIFYAWQSDLPNAVNRTFIHKALDLAVKRLSADLDLVDAFRVDRDTFGVPGSPTIAEVIFDKIDNCSVFVADITTIVKIDDGRAVPNPNVMIEYGRASSRGDGILIQVFNEAFGDWERERPFDLRHKRKPITYNLADGETSEAKQKQLLGLSKDLESAIRLILQNTPTENIDPKTDAFDRFIATYAGIRHPKWTHRNKRIIGFWCAALPVAGSLQLGRMSQRKDLLISRAYLSYFLPGASRSLTCETFDNVREVSPSIKPIANGICAEIQRDFKDIDGSLFEGPVSQQIVWDDGGIFIGVRSANKKMGPQFSIRWVMADVANVLRTIRLIQQAAKADSVSYALTLELRYDDQSDDDLRPVSSGQWRLCDLADESGVSGPIVSSAPLRLKPRVVRPSDDFAGLLREIFMDIWDAVGRDSPAGISFDMDR